MVGPITRQIIKCSAFVLQVETFGPGLPGPCYNDLSLYGSEVRCVKTGLQLSDLYPLRSVAQVTLPGGRFSFSSGSHRFRTDMSALSPHWFTCLTFNFKYLNLSPTLFKLLFDIGSNFALFRSVLHVKCFWINGAAAQALSAHYY